MTLEQADISQTRADIARDVRAMRMHWAKLAVVLGLVVGAFQIYPYFVARSMLAHGIKTDVVVTEKNQWSHFGPKGEWLEYTVAYEFTDKNGERVQSSAGYDPSVTPIKVGDLIRIVYDAHTPSVNDRLTTYELQADLEKIILSVLMTMGTISTIGYFIGYLLRRKLNYETRRKTHTQ